MNENIVRFRRKGEPIEFSERGRQLRLGRVTEILEDFKATDFLNVILKILDNNTLLIQPQYLEGEYAGKSIAEDNLQSYCDELQVTLQQDPITRACIVTPYEFELDSGDITTGVKIQFFFEPPQADEADFSK